MIDELNQQQIDDFPDFMDSLYASPEPEVPEPAFPLWLTGLLGITFGVIAIEIVIGIVMIGRELWRSVAK